MHDGGLPDAVVGFAEAMDALFAPSREAATVDAFRSRQESVGPTYVICGMGDAEPIYERAHGTYPAEGARAAVPFRSVSKVFVALAYLLLVHRGTLSLDAVPGDVLDLPPSPRAWRRARARDLLAMAPTLDNSANTAWRNASPRADHNGFPTVCEVEGFGLEECLRTVVLPVYDRRPSAGRLARTLVQSLDKAQDLTCTNRHRACCQWAMQGECSRNPLFMEGVCGSACGFCEGKATCVGCHDLATDCKDRAQRGHCTAAEMLDYMRAACLRTCGLCDTRSPTARGYPGDFARRTARLAPSTEPRVFDFAPVNILRDARALPEVIMYHNRGQCVYDNYGYSLLDLMVQKTTGAGLLRWAADLLLAPMGADDTRWCSLGHGRADGTRCYGNYHTARPLGDWPLRAPGPYSTTWVSNALVGSARDLANLATILATGGVLRGRRIVPQAIVEALFESATDMAHRSAAECMGMTSFGLGVGYCDTAEKRTDRCAADDWFGWCWHRAQVAGSSALPHPRGSSPQARELRIAVHRHARHRRVLCVGEQPAQERGLAREGLQPHHRAPPRAWAQCERCHAHAPRGGEAHVPAVGPRLIEGVCASNDAVPPLEPQAARPWSVWGSVGHVHATDLARAPDDV